MDIETGIRPRALRAGGRRIKPIHLVTLSAPVAMIGDQLSFLSEALTYFGQPCETGTSLDESALNVVIEGFTPFGSRTIRDFCERTGKKIAVVMTEHIARAKEIIFNDVPMSKANEYTPNAPGRLRNLCQILPYVRAFWIAGHLPDGAELAKVFPHVPLIHVPYIPMPVDEPSMHVHRRFELSFTGTTTKYRRAILDEINRFYNCCHTFSDDANLRRRIVMESMYTLQIPQHPRWRYISPMRALFSLKAGTPMLNVSAYEDEIFDGIVPRVPPTDVVASLAHYMSLDARAVYQESVAAYNAMAERTIAASKLSTALQVWDDLE
jgi:hypothetical protein